MNAMNNVSALEEAKHQLVNAQSALAAIQAVNERDKVWNEHVFHVEKGAEKLVRRLEKEIAELEAGSTSSDDKI